MIRPSKKLLYAVEAVLDIAYNAGDTPVQSSEIAERQGIPRRYLERVLQQLVRDGVLAGTRGPRGGYRLARERRRVTVGEIARVVQALETEEDELADLPGSALGQQIIRPLWQGLSEEFMGRLDGVTLDDLCRQAQAQGIARQTDDRIDFTI